MSNPKWADVAHYYQFSAIEIQLPCGNRAFKGVTGQISGDSNHKKAFYLDAGGHYTRSTDANVSQYLPILRALEDMTGEEAREYYTLKTGLDSKYVNRLIIRGKSADIVSVEYLKKYRSAAVIFVDIANKATPIGGQYAPKELAYLIQKGFNVFGLEWGTEAIRKGVES